LYENALERKFLNIKIIILRSEYYPQDVIFLHRKLCDTAPCERQSDMATTSVPLLKKTVFYVICLTLIRPGLCA
jgi:hypothetical protein